MDGRRPKNVGILAIEWYSPMSFVEQRELEIRDGCVGKYVTGLGQERMAFVDDREDIGSVLLTACARLLENYGIEAKEIGRLEVGTESLVDKSKSIKTSLLRLLGEESDAEGVTSVNACYGGTAAFLNSVAWVESSAWDGRLAVVVCGDVAVYEAGPARPSGGCGAVAMLVGPDAPIVLDPKRATCGMDVWDFYKPRGDSEYATVDGKLSQACYLSSVDRCWGLLNRKAGCSLETFDYYCFHAPYNKLVQKGLARLVLADALESDSPVVSDRWRRDLSSSPLWASPEYDASLSDKALDAALRKAAPYEAKVAPTTLLPKNVGNAYTASVFYGLVSLIAAGPRELLGKRVLLFSYGSGSMATMYSLTFREGARFTLAKIAETTAVSARLDARLAASPDDFHLACDLREAAYGKAPFEPKGTLPLAPGVFYLAGIDAAYRRSYARAPK
ncbi:hypothetical protein CTAYLR_005222 [Chrysophaeum taylorii]|uniref:Hydroxymethylglutaryl-CoA synthase n=1 Tax=Chrysophaeum taylorii TaxID=2483200 RepID=A0AAD7XHF0_9STRA|nr:hypothetical protein CTAYLR_005222 [Chrysophaeum taylorii]